MADPIRISALGRDGKVGDFYNYLTDAIVPSSIDVPNERKSISKTVEIPTFEFFYQQPEKFKSLLLGINSRLLQNINKWSASNQQLWFSDYLNTNSMDGDERHAQVTLLFRVVRRTEALDPDFLRSKIDDYRLKSGDVGALHVIDQVVYGAEVICSMRKALDSSQETKEATEVSMYLAAKTYLDETIRKSSTAELPVELDQVSLTCLSSLEPGKKNNVNFDSLNRYLQRLLNTEENQVKWKPIDFLIRSIPAIKIEAQLWSERKTKIDLEKDRHQVTKEWMMKYIHEISKNPLLKRFPLLEKHVCHFQHLVTHFWKKVEETYKTFETIPPEQDLGEMLSISDYLNKIIDWFANRRKNIQEIGWLLSGTDFALLNSEEIKDQMTSKDYKKAKLFILNVEYKHDPLVNGMEKLLGQETSTAMLPVLKIFSCEKERLQSVYDALIKFAKEAKWSTWGSGYNTSYHIELDSSTLNDAAVVTVDYSYQPPQIISGGNEVEHFKKQEQQFRFSSSSVSASLPPPLIPTVVSNQNQQLKSAKDDEHSNTHSTGNAELLYPEQPKMEIDLLSSDVESSDGDCSREETGSTKIKSSTKDSVETSITSKNQIEPQKSEQNSPTAQVKLYGANVTEQSTSIPTPVQKNCNNYGSMERNSIINKSICEGDAKTSVMFPSQAESMTQHWDKRDGIGGGRGNGSIKNSKEIDPFEDQNATRHSKTNSSKKDQTGIRSAPDETILSLEEMSLHDTNARKPSTSADSPHQKNFNDGRSKERNVTRPDKVGGAEEFDFDADQDNKTHRNMKSYDNRRIAEIYADESRSYSKLIRNGSPNVYLLNATEKSNSEKINWFDICRPGDPIMRSRNPKNQKIIILMGATGSGKSTLINGMINYILGVQWNDPFRFKCVREDENAAKNQAHSQTSSVTAYTLHHQEGMTIPYSITIIDTPGYGDTRGVKRDKEITAAIHRFLTQQEIPIDEIHAACFVAASGDSRLTATQRYIIDSVLSIFGKDMKANLRLLVTFADNADPPVVGACLSANFPTTSASDGIAYSKFNSSVLYCSNAKQGDDEFSFDQLFWDMGHENFKKFFDMLERMKGRDLTSTREVIHSRRQLEQSLKDIEQEMEVCLTNIENIEIFQRKMKTCGHNMEATKNFTVEQTIMRRRMFKCPKGFFAYNCQKCDNTCERLITKKSLLHKTKRRCEKKACKCSPFDHSVEEMEWRQVSEKVSKTLLDMKAQYELNYDGKMTAEKILNASSDDLQIARAKVLSLLQQVAENVRLLESTALRSNVLSPSDYLSLMRSRVQEEQAPGYMTRLETLDDIQRMLAGATSQPIRSTAAMPNQEFRLLSSNTERVSDSSVTPSYGQAYNKEPSLPTTQPTPVYGDVSESKSGRSWPSKDWVSSFFSIGKPAESDNQSQQQKKKNETWKF